MSSAADMPPPEAETALRFGWLLCLPAFGFECLTTLTDDQRLVLAVKGREFGMADLSIKENVANRRAFRIACRP